MKKAPKALTPFGSFFVWICSHYTPSNSKKSSPLSYDYSVVVFQIQ